MLLQLACWRVYLNILRDLNTLTLNVAEKPAGNIEFRILRHASPESLRTLSINLSIYLLQNNL